MQEQLEKEKLSREENLNAVEIENTIDSATKEPNLESEPEYLRLPFNIRLTKKEAIRWALDALIVIAGCTLMAIGAIAFFMPHDIVPGGFSGFAIVLFRLYYNTPMSWLTPGILVIIMNIPLFIVAIKIKGRMFGVLSVVGMVSFSLIIDLFIHLDLYELLAPVTDGNPLFATLYGGLLSGLGWGILVRRGGSTGGTDTLSNILHTKFPRLNYGTFLLFVDGFVVLFSGLVFGILETPVHGVQSALFAFLGVFLTSMIAEYIIGGKNRATAYYIICADPAKMSNVIMERVKRGVTALEARGIYKNEQREVLLCVIKRAQAIHLKRVVFEVDPNAFMFSQNTQEVFGKGFLTEVK